MIKIVKVKMGEAELLAQLAEEAAEMGQAALKLRRVIDGKNPTPVTYDDAMENLLEEMADVDLVLTVLGYTENIEATKARKNIKLARWAHRLAKATFWEDKTESGLLEE